VEGWARGGQVRDWPTGLGSKGNPGVAFTIDQTPGAIGYLEYSSIVTSGTATAALQNREGAFVAPSIKSARAALARVEMPADLIAWAPDPVGPDSYPIISFTWILYRKVYDEPEVGKTLKKVLLFAVGESQKWSKDLGYVPLPEAIAERVRTAIETIEVHGAPPETTPRSPS
jgi:phosphate transport system substrate-binding protein